MHNNLREGGPRGGRANGRGARTSSSLLYVVSPSAFGDNAVTRFADGDECPSCLPPALALALIPSFLLPSSSAVLSIRRFR